MADIKKRNQIIQDLLNELIREGGPPQGMPAMGLTQLPDYTSRGLPPGQTGQQYINQMLSSGSPRDVRAELAGYQGQQGSEDLDIDLLIKILNEEVARRSIKRK